MSTRLGDIVHGLDALAFGYSDFIGGSVEDEYEHARSAVQSMIMLLKGAIAP